MWIRSKGCMKLVFVDIDGTLTPPGENVPPESAVRAIKKAQGNGHKVFVYRTEYGYA